MVNPAINALQSFAIQANDQSEEAKIDKSAKDFESILLGNWLQQAEESIAKVPGTDDEEDDDSSSTQMQSEMAMRPLGDAMAASGGIGIAKMIATQLRETAETPLPVSFRPDGLLKNSLSHK
jgi:Rod binding domain-containing protein